MNIIIGLDEADKMKDKYTVLPLETMKFKSNPELPPVTAYCLIESIPITEMNKVDEQMDLHTKFYENYQRGDFTFCTMHLNILRASGGVSWIVTMI